MTANVVFLTGASSGMGKLIAKTLAGRGDTVFAGMRNIATSNAANAAELAGVSLTGRIVPVEIDVTDEESVIRGVASVLDQGFRIDVLVNCAGIMWTGISEAFSTAQFEKMLQTNVLGPFRLMKAVLPGMRDEGTGLLITITSTCGRVIPPNFGLYSASKFAAEAMAESIGYETADLGIQSVILEPGPFATNLQANQVAPAGADIVAQYGPMGQFDRELAKHVNAMCDAEPDAVDPQIVADLVAEVIDMPAAERPLRIPVGRSGNVPELNNAIAAAQGEFLTGIGLGHLAR